jgi:hypothetical protein
MADLCKVIIDLHNLMPEAVNMIMEELGISEDAATEYVIDHAEDFGLVVADE